MFKITNESTLFINWILILSIIITLIFTPIHPIIITVLLTTHTILISINISLWKSNYLYSIILFLIIIRGLIIIFIYFSRLISNEKIIYPNKTILIIYIYLLLILTPVTKLLKNFIIKYQFKEINYSLKLNYKLFNSIINIYEYPHTNLTILIILFLIICFLIIIKICSPKSFPIRKINYDKI